jgi:hypothetical protein
MIKCPHLNQCLGQNGISQLFGGTQKCMYVGVIATYGKHILLPLNSRNLINGSFIISLQCQHLGALIFAVI